MFPSLYLIIIEVPTALQKCWWDTSPAMNSLWTKQWINIQPLNESQFARITSLTLSSRPGERSDDMRNLDANLQSSPVREFWRRWFGTKTERIPGSTFQVDTGGGTIHLTTTVKVSFRGWLRITLGYPIVVRDRLDIPDSTYAHRYIRLTRITDVEL